MRMCAHTVIWSQEREIDSVTDFKEWLAIIKGHFRKGHLKERQGDYLKYIVSVGDAPGGSPGR